MTQWYRRKHAMPGAVPSVEGGGGHEPGAPRIESGIAQERMAGMQQGRPCSTGMFTCAIACAKCVTLLEWWVQMAAAQRGLSAARVGAAAQAYCCRAERMKAQGWLVPVRLLSAAKDGCGMRHMPPAGSASAYPGRTPGWYSRRCTGLVPGAHRSVGAACAAWPRPSKVMRRASTSFGSQKPRSTNSWRILLQQE